ncbi:hypothetical protein NQ318_003504 [Aromia moschata]|uniref:Uncharacterized protein n=1 Tax=Aromia moschata TaxID=1265417 RepID=A0AAV8YV94_9CUCU|nr:hypothetical protein NQ318_003504 [Aromia moschata]
MDEYVASLHLPTFDAHLTELTDEQANNEYKALCGWVAVANLKEAAIAATTLDQSKSIDIALITAKFEDDRPVASYRSCALLKSGNTLMNMAIGC